MTLEIKEKLLIRIRVLSGNKSNVHRTMCEFGNELTREHAHKSGQRFDI